MTLTNILILVLILGTFTNIIVGLAMFSVANSIKIYLENKKRISDETTLRYTDRIEYLTKKIGEIGVK